MEEDNVQYVEIFLLLCYKYKELIHLVLELLDNILYLEIE